MRFVEFISFLSGYSYLMKKRDTTNREASILIDIIEEMKKLLTKSERKRYNYLLLTIQKNLRKIKETNNNKIKEFETQLSKLKIES